MGKDGLVFINGRTRRNTHQAIHNLTNRDGILSDVIVGAGDARPIVLDEDQRTNLACFYRAAELLSPQFSRLNFLYSLSATPADERGINRSRQRHVFERNQSKGLPLLGVLRDGKNRVGVTRCEMPTLGQLNLKHTSEDFGGVEILRLRLEAVPTDLSRLAP